MFDDAHSQCEVTGELSLRMRITEANTNLDEIDKGMLSEELPSQR